MQRTTLAITLILIVGCGQNDLPAPPTPSPAQSRAMLPVEGKRMHFEHQEFIIDLNPSWRALPSSDPEQFVFESTELKSTLTISVMPATIPRSKARQAAEKLLEFRVKAESDVDAARKLTVGDKWVTEKPDNDVIEVAYAGYDDRGRIFRFMGFVTTNKIVSFYCETLSSDNEQAKRIFDESFRGFRYYTP